MKTYKAVQGDFTYLKNFNSLLEAETYYASKLTGVFTVSEASNSEQIPVKTAAQQVDEDIEFGVNLSKEFLVDEKEFERTPEQAYAIELKFSKIDYYLHKGAIKVAKLMMEELVPDELVSEERLQKYLTKINNYILCLTS